MLLIGALLSLALMILAMTVRHPWSILIPFTLTHFGGDGFGLASYLISIGFGGLLYVIRALTIGVMIHSTYAIWQESRTIPARRPAFLLSMLAATGSIWICLTWIVKGGAFWSSFNAMLYPALAIVPICLAMTPHRLLRMALAIITAQLLVGTLVTYSPDLPLMSEISGRQYEYLNAPEATGMNPAPELGRLSGGERPQAQMNNANSFGLYAVLGISIGIFSLIYLKGKWKITSALCLILSIVTWYLTISRGSTAGLILGISLYLLLMTIFNRKNRIFSSISTAILISSTIFSLAILSDSFGNLVNFDFNQDASYTYRTDAIYYGLQAIGQWPLFGVPNLFQWPYNIAPHQLPLYFMATYGIFGGVILLLIYGFMIFIFVRSTFSPSIGRLEYRELLLSSALVGTFLGTTMTNNVASPVILWMTFSLASQVLIGSIYQNVGKQS